MKKIESFKELKKGDQIKVTYKEKEVFHIVCRVEEDELLVAEADGSKLAKDPVLYTEEDLGCCDFFLIN